MAAASPNTAGLRAFTSQKAPVIGEIYADKACQHLALCQVDRHTDLTTDIIQVRMPTYKTAIPANSVLRRLPRFGSEHGSGLCTDWRQRVATDSSDLGTLPSPISSLR